MFKSFYPTTALTVTLFLSACFTEATGEGQSSPDELVSGSEAASLESAPGESAAAPRMAQVCRSLMVRQRECTEQFIPALVQARVQADDPAGLVGNRGDISPLIRVAFEEWQVDSQDTAIASLCDRLGREIPAGRVPELGRAVDGCLAEPSCGTFVSCAVPLNLVRWTETAQ
jgi:hypothetical protein